LITGGTSGLGFECASHLAQDHAWHVLITGRSAQSAQSAALEITQHTGNVHVEGRALDLARLADVRRFAGAVRQRDDLPPLRALVCNAGVQIVSGLSFTPDGSKRPSPSITWAIFCW